MAEAGGVITLLIILRRQIRHLKGQLQLVLPIKKQFLQVVIGQVTQHPTGAVVGVGVAVLEESNNKNNI